MARDKKREKVLKNSLKQLYIQKLEKIKKIKTKLKIQYEKILLAKNFRQYLETIMLPSKFTTAATPNAQQK